MLEPKYVVTMKDIQRYRILKDVSDKKIKSIQAALILGITPVHLCRLKKRFMQGGLDGLLRPRRSPANKISDAKRTIISDLYKERYPDFNIMHFKDKLSEIHKISLSYESIRKILIRYGIHAPKKKKIVHRRRRRMPKAGMLVQMDSSIHQWLACIKEDWALVAMIDDATSEVPYAEFFPKDTTLANMRVIRRFIEKKGLFMALYVDKASHFTTTRYQGVHYNVNPEQDDTQIERALKELEIELIPANSPQAKGRIERLFRLFQDRLIKEMRLAGIGSYAQANRFLLNKFLPWYNKRFLKKNIESVYSPVPVAKDLNLIFCIKKERLVKGDNTVQVLGQHIQIPPSDMRLSFAKARVDVCLRMDNLVTVLYNNRVIAKAKIHGNNKTLRKERTIENFLTERNYEPALA
jgi:transposase